MNPGNYDEKKNNNIDKDLECQLNAITNKYKKLKWNKKILLNSTMVLVNDDKFKRHDKMNMTYTKTKNNQINSFTKNDTDQEDNNFNSSKNFNSESKRNNTLNNSITLVESVKKKLNKHRMTSENEMISSKIIDKYKNTHNASNNVAIINDLSSFQDQCQTPSRPKQSKFKSIKS